MPAAGYNRACKPQAPVPRHERAEGANPGRVLAVPQVFRNRSYGHSKGIMIFLWFVQRSLHCRIRKSMFYRERSI